ncbi:nucleoside hydrolase [Streptomyces sp900105755]|uniref:Nucleoside hydrolase n=1 Tax=Streptomyces sp. 900105755 TaxID=3154389 RepID=A0ABV1TWT8_9ACTN
MTSERLPLVIDTDPGIDDAFAITLAAISPHVDLRAITTVFGNASVEQTTRNALKVLAMCGRDDVRVARGAECPLVYPHPHRAEYAHGKDGLGGASDSLPASQRTEQARPAVEVLAGVLKAAQTPVTIAVIGPMTNIALLLAVYPELRPRIGRLVVMGGAAAGGNVSATAEFNVWSDPEAARRVLVESDVPTTLVPIDLTHRAWVDDQWLKTLASSGPTGASLVSVSTPYRTHYQRELGVDGLVLHDAVAVAEAIWPGTLKCRRLTVDVVCDSAAARGATVIDTRSGSEDARAGREIDVALDADIDALRDLLLNKLSSGLS